MFRSSHLLRCAPLLLLQLIALPRQASAQDPCDSLSILHVRYHPFSDTLVNVQVHNTGTQFFSNPYFHLISAGGDTLAVEVFEFFGIGNAPQTHHLALQPGMALPATPFTGNLTLLYYGWDGEDTCTYAVDTDLCPPDSCTPMNVFLYSLAGSNDLFTTSFNWQVSDDQGAVVGSGTLAIAADDQQQDFADLCLPPGHYTLQVQQPEDIGLNYAVGVCQEGNQFTNVGPGVFLAPGGTVTLSFDYYAPCIDGSNSIQEALPAVPVLTLDGRILRVRSGNGAPLGPLMVKDATGRTIATMIDRSLSATIDLNGAAAGVYLICGAGNWPAQRFVLR